MWPCKQLKSCYETFRVLINNNGLYQVTSLVFVRVWFTVMRGVFVLNYMFTLVHSCTQDKYSGKMTLLARTS